MNENLTPVMPSRDAGIVAINEMIEEGIDVGDLILMVIAI